MQHSNVWISASIWMKRLNWKEWRPEKDFEERSKNRIYWLITSKVSRQERWTKCPNVNQVQFKILGRKNSQPCQNPIFTWSICTANTGGPSTIIFAPARIPRTKEVFSPIQACFLPRVFRHSRFRPSRRPRWCTSRVLWRSRPVPGREWYPWADLLHLLGLVSCTVDSSGLRAKWSWDVQSCRRQCLKHQRTQQHHVQSMMAEQGSK